jgi:hypothetical protein
MIPAVTTYARMRFSALENTCNARSEINPGHGLTYSVAYANVMQFGWGKHCLSSLIAGTSI